jgi:hypothetical protein
MKNVRTEVIELYQYISGLRGKNAFRVISVMVEFTPGNYKRGK